MYNEEQLKVHWDWYCLGYNCRKDTRPVSSLISSKFEILSFGLNQTTEIDTLSYCTHNHVHKYHFHTCVAHFARTSNKMSRKYFVTINDRVCIKC